LALFGYYDVDRDGALSYYEFINKVLESGFGLDDGKAKGPVKMAQLAVVLPDEKNDLEIKTVLRKEDLDVKICREIFDRFDANQSGEIDLRELQQLTRSLGLSMDRESINNAMFDLDMNRNGAISFDEFWSWWQQNAILGVSRGMRMTGGAKSPSKDRPNRPQSQQSFRSASKAQGGILSRPKSSQASSQLNDLKSAIMAEADKARPGSRGSQGMGSWFSQGGAHSGRPFSRASGRPDTRNSQRSVAGQDYSPPPALTRPPKLHGIRSMWGATPPRPKTAPDGQSLGHSMMMNARTGAGGFLSEHIRVPGEQAAPVGTMSGYIL